MFGKRSRIIFLAVAILFVGSYKSKVQAQTLVIPSTYEETIKLFPDNLQSGFYGMYVVLLTGASEERALRTIQSFYLVNFVKENYITKGRGAEKANDSMTYFDYYTQNRTSLLSVVGTIPIAAAGLGNPGGTNWDVWYQQLMAWL